MAPVAPIPDLPAGPILPGKRPELLDFLWQAQRRYGRVRDRDVAAAGRALGISEVEVEGVVSFYHFLSREPRGRHTIYLDNSAVAQAKGFARVREAFENATGARLGQVDPSGEFGLFETPCMGLSDLQPSALIDFHPFTNLHSLKVRDLVTRLRQGERPADLADPVPDHLRHAPDPDRSLFLRDYQPGRAIRAMLRQDPAWVIAQIKASGLRGMSGAFFPAGIKLAHCAGQAEPRRFVACNADEGEPGTFKDRVLMSALPGLVLEGMVVAAYAVGAREGLFYLRAEYAWLLDRLERTIEEFRESGWLGRDIGGRDGFHFDLRIQLGAGSYVCGEETAMLNSMEGLRGEPRNKRVFPTERGYLGFPTLVQNVETLAAFARILELGVEHFRAAGTESSPGTKLLSIAGDCRAPGIYEVEWGTSVREVLSLCRADEPAFVQLGGAMGEVVSPREWHRKIAVDDLRCGGSVMVFDRSRDLLDMLRNFNDFFRAESCGICTPCRAGNFILQKKLQRFADGLAQEQDVSDLRAWGRLMQAGSRCGLGKTAPTALLSALDRFPDYFIGIVQRDDGGLNRAFNLRAAVNEHEQFGTSHSTAKAGEGSLR